MLADAGNFARGGGAGGLSWPARELPIVTGSSGVEPGNSGHQESARRGRTDLHQWLVPTRTFQRTLFGADGGTTGIDDDFAARGFKNVGAWILGRNMFGPIRGSWPDMNWKGDCSRGLTCALWDTNAFSSLRRRKPPMLYSGAKGTMTPNNRLQRTALPRRR